MFAKVDHISHDASLTFDDGKPVSIGQFPARWERALNQWANSNDNIRVKRFLNVMCNLRSPTPRKIQWNATHGHVLEPLKMRREGSAVKKAMPPSIVTVHCEESCTEGLA